MIEKKFAKQAQCIGTAYQRYIIDTIYSCLGMIYSRMYTKLTLNGRERDRKNVHPHTDTHRENL